MSAQMQVKMKNQTFLSYLRPALDTCKKNKGLFFLSIFLDILFFIAIIASQVWILTIVRDSVLKVMEIVQQTAGELAQAEAVAQVSPELFKTPELMAEFQIILKYFLILIGLVFLFWIVFKGINWFIAHKMLKKVDAKKFTIKFMLYSLLAFVFLLIWFVIVMRLISYSTSAFLPLMSVGLDRIFLFLGIAVLNYFVFITYSMIPYAGCRKIWNFGIKNYRVLVPAYLFWLIALMILSYLTVWVISINYWAPAIFALLITIPAFAYGRIYILVVVNNVLKRGR